MLTQLKKIKTILGEYISTAPLPHPLYIVTSAYIAGTCYAHLSYIGIILSLSAGILMSLLHVTQKKTYALMTILMITGCEFGYFRTKYQIEKFNTIQQTCVEGPFNVTLYVQDYKKLYDKMASCCITGTILKAQHCATQKSCEELTHATVQLFCNTQQFVAIQDTITIEHLSFSRVGHTNPFGLYLMRNGINATAHCSNLIYMQRATNNAPYLCSEKMQQTIIERFTEKLHGYTATLFHAIFLGYKHVAQKRFSIIKQQFRLWGIEHYLARSGLHMALLALLWMYILSLLPVGLNNKYGIVLVGACIYTYCTIGSISFMRTFLFFCCYKLLGMINAPVHNFHLFIIIMFAVVIYNPMYIFFLDFQLSFILAGSLVWIHAIMRHKKQRIA